jgi:hypothetical protein
MYQYENRNGEIVQKLVSVDQRDGLEGLNRIPSVPYIPRGAADPDSSEQGARSFYRTAEEKGSLRSRKYSKKRVKEIWGW